MGIPPVRLVPPIRLVRAEVIPEVVAFFVDGNVISLISAMDLTLTLTVLVRGIWVFRWGRRRSAESASRPGDVMVNKVIAHAVRGIPPPGDVTHSHDVGAGLQDFGLARARRHDYVASLHAGMAVRTHCCARKASGPVKLKKLHLSSRGVVDHICGFGTSTPASCFSIDGSCVPV